jgi:hypothetical protein
MANDWLIVGCYLQRCRDVAMLRLYTLCIIDNATFIEGAPFLASMLPDGGIEGAPFLASMLAFC